MIAFRYKAILRRIVDGDTLICDVDLGFKVYTTQRVRLWGINTPETRTRNLEEKKKGLAAKERLTEIMESVETFYLESHEVGKYGRCLGSLFLHVDFSKSINEQLVEEGHAVEYFGGRRYR